MKLVAPAFRSSLTLATLVAPAARRCTLALAAATGIVSFLGCGDGDVGDKSDATATNTSTSTGTGTGSTTTDTGIAAGKAEIRLVHASPDAPAVDVWAKGGSEPLVTGLAYGDASPYLELDAGTYDVELRVSPSKATDAAVYATGPIAVAEKTRVTAVAAGLIGSDASAERFRVLTLGEGFAPAGTGSAVIRVVHASPDAPSVGIDLHDDDASSPEITGLDRFSDSGAAGFAVSSGAALQVGIAAGGARVTAFTTPALPEGADLFVIATGLVGHKARETDGFALLAVGPDGAIGFIKQNPVVYALHASPDAPTVDLFAAERELVSDLSFGHLAGPLQVPPGDYTLDAFGATPGTTRPDGNPAASGGTGTLSAGESYLAIATGFLSSSGNDGFRFAAYAEGFDASQPEDARIRLVHGCPDAPAVDVGILNAEKVVNPVLVPNVSFGGASDPAGISTGVGTLPLGVTPAGQDSTVVASFHVTTTAGVRAFAIASGALAPNKGQSFRLLAVDTTPTPWTVATIWPQPQ